MPRAACWAGRAARASTSRSARRWFWSGATLAQVERARRRCAARSWPTPRPTRSPRSCSPPAPPACPRAWSTGTGISSRRSRCCATAFGVAARRRRPADLSAVRACSIRRSGLTSIIPDMDPTRPAARRSAQAAATRSSASASTSCSVRRRWCECWRDMARRLPGIRRVTSAGAPVPPDVVAGMRALLPERRAVVDALRRDRMPAGGGDRRPRTAGHARGHRTRRRHLRRPAGAAERGAHHRHQRRRHCPSGIGRLQLDAGHDRRDHRRRPVDHRRLLPSAGGDRAGEDPRAPARRQRAHRPSHGRPGLVRCAGPAVVLRAQVAPRAAPNCGSLCTEQVEPVFNVHPDVRRTALVGVGAKGHQRPVLCVELRAGRRAPTRTRASLAELRAHRPGLTRTPDASKLSWSTRTFRSTSATTPRSAASSWRSGRQRNCVSCRQ